MPTQLVGVPSMLPFNYITDSGQVGMETAKRFSAVFASASLIADSISTMPFNVFRQENNQRIKIYNKLSFVVKNSPSQKMTSASFFEGLILNILFAGNGYAEIKRNNNGEILSFHLLDSNKVEVLEDEFFLYYKYNNRIIHQDNMIHVPGKLSENGITGVSVIRAGINDISIGSQTQKYGLKFFTGGSLLQGYLTTEKSLTPEARRKNGEAWSSVYSGEKNWHKVGLLDEGMEFKRTGIAPEEAQFIETRKFTIEDIARIFRVPPHKIGHLERSTNNNIEQQNIEFATGTLRPLLTKIEQEYNRKIFKESEKGIYYCKFNDSSLMRGDSGARAQYYKDLYYIGALSSNDVREKEDMNPREGGDVYLSPVNMRTDEEIKLKIKEDGSSK